MKELNANSGPVRKWENVFPEYAHEIWIFFLFCFCFWILNNYLNDYFPWKSLPSHVNKITIFYLSNARNVHL